MGRTRGRHMYAGRRGRRPLPCLTPVRTPRPVHTHGRARRPRRAAPTGRPRGRPRERHMYAGRRGRRPLPCLTHVHTPTPGPHPTSCRHHMVGRDVLGAPRPLDALGDAHGNATCTRAAGDVGPYHASRPVHTPRPVHTHGRARRPRRAAHTGRPRERPRGRHMYAGRRGRRPLPCLTHVYTPTSCPYPTSGPHPW